jgi:hypothetical protein
MNPATTIALLALMFSPIYTALGYLIVKEKKQDRKISGVIDVLDDVVEDIDIQDEIPHYEG